MKWKIFENGTLIDMIVADEDFCRTYCADFNYTYELIPEETAHIPTSEERIADLEHENTLLRAQVQAMSDRNDFIEDCIAEMAEIVYA